LLLTLVILFGMESISASRMPAIAASERTTQLEFFVQLIGQDTFLDLGIPGFSQGDEFIFHDLVFTADGRTQVGHDGGMGVIFDVATLEENCTLTFALPRGEITTQFLTSTGPAPKPFAVTGGTGSYRNVRGQEVLAESSQETATLSFDLIGVHDDE
jgi:hypothetical protein